MMLGVNAMVVISPLLKQITVMQFSSLDTPKAKSAPLNEAESKCNSDIFIDADSSQLLFNMSSNEYEKKI